jgi:hypothetical protein
VAFYFYVGRFFQFLGLVIVPVGVLLSIQHDTLKPELLYLGIGGGLFLLGTLLTRAYGEK